MASAAPKPSDCKRLFVAAIDFGTTYSGYAFSPKAEWTKVQTNIWPSSNQMSSKTPTALLLNPNGTFHSFGYEAEAAYAQLAEEGDNYEDYYYFHRFKMLLHNCKNLHRNICIDDMTRKRMEAHKVFTHSIKYLVDQLFGKLKGAVPDINMDDIQFVLTVPAIWDDPSKQFMREAATAAGINANQLSVALEPEAASIYCQHIPTEVAVSGNSSFLRKSKEGTKYMILDLGGGTADITVHLRSGEGILDEVRPASGGPWGGKSVDDQFMKFLSKVFGDDLLEELKTNNMEDYLDLVREFESKKRNINTTKNTGKVHMKIPLALQSLTKQKLKSTVQDALKISEYCESVHFANMKLHISVDTFKALFRPTIDGIVKHLGEVFLEKSLRDVPTILMVGGFSECELVQAAIKENFTDKKVIIPEEPGLAVLKGAVYYGHVPKTIGRRIARYTYGIQSWPEFDPNRHPENKKVMIGTTARCRDVFFKYVTKGETLTPGYRRSQIFQALKPDEECLECAVYVSDEESPDFVDGPSCRKLGMLRVPLPRVSTGCSLEIEETMVFGDTELNVQARDIYTNQQCEVSFDLLGINNNIVQNGN